MHIARLVQKSFFLVALTAIPSFAQTAADPNKPAATSGTGTGTGDSLDRDRDHNNYGWIGLVGLGGLAGLLRRGHTHPDAGRVNTGNTRA